MMFRLLIFGLAIITLLSSCGDDQGCTTTYTYKTIEPVYKTMDELSENVNFVQDRLMEQPGKIYYYNRLILINEIYQGVHIINNADPQHPQKVGFIEINGNIDISLSGNYLYADTEFYILVIDISDYEHPEIVHVIQDAKEYYWGPEGDRFVAGFQQGTQSYEVPCDEYPGAVLYIDNQILFDVAAPSSSPELIGGGVLSDASGQRADGIGGSLARMALFNRHFYYVNDHSMHIYDVSDLSTPDKVSEVYMEWGVETIFPYQDNIFIGANNGMHIYDNSVPSDPRYLSTFSHARACDPVVVQDDLAYITLRNGQECETFTNQLDVVDISDLLRPQLLASFPMEHPHGLSVQGDHLYLCEGEAGLKVFDIKDPEVIHEHLLAHQEGYHAYDVISVRPDLLLMVGDDGFYQWDTEVPADLYLLSSIKKGE